LAPYVRNLVVARQPLVDERIVRRQQIHDAAVLAAAGSKELGLALERLTQALVEVGKVSGAGFAFRDCAAAATAPKLSTSAAARNGGRRRTCRRAPGILQLPAPPDQQLIVRKAAPEEERQTGGQLEVADAVDSVRGDVGRIV
jgi:hypothetical protein